MECSVTYLDGRSSKSHQATLHVFADEVEVRDGSGHCLEKAMLTNLTLNPPLSDRARFLKFAGGARCQLTDVAVIEALDHKLRSSPGLNLVHFFESSWRMVFVSSMALVLFSWGVMTYAIPAIASHLAQAIPVSVMDSLSAKTLAMLDERFFAETALGAKRQQEIRALFRPICHDFGQDARCEVLFRRGGDDIGANAFALPSGQIVVTDEFIGLAASNQEIEGVLAHEMAHVQKRHSIRHVLQHTGIFLLVSALVGDIGSISSLATTLPTVLAESKYSRKFEEEADRVACLYLLSKGKSTKPFQDVLTRITEDTTVRISWFSSHPETTRRVELMGGIEQDFLRDAAK